MVHNLSTLESIIAAVVAGLILTYAVPQIWRRLNLARGRIRIRLTEDLPDQRVALTLRHVRDGKDVVDEKGLLKNRDVLFRRTSMTGEFAATVAYERRLGFQFKCYVESPPQFETAVRQTLVSSGIVSVENEQNHRERLWFLLPNAEMCRTVDGYENNFFGPNISEVLHDGTRSSRDPHAGREGGI